VYRDQHTKKRRESSLTVSGLQPTLSRPDKLLFTDLCSAELDIQPDIVFLKRIGPQPDKIQPLLVTLRKVDQAQRLISDARQLLGSLPMRQFGTTSSSTQISLEQRLKQLIRRECIGDRLHRNALTENAKAVATNMFQNSSSSTIMVRQLH
jgi:hypothetical protein